AHGALGQLPRGREHLLHRRPHSAYRDGAAQDAEPRPQVAEREQGSARLAWPVARHEARDLAAGWVGSSVKRAKRVRVLRPERVTCESRAEPDDSQSNSETKNRARSDAPRKMTCD